MVECAVCSTATPRRNGRQIYCSGRCQLRAEGDRRAARGLPRDYKKPKPSTVRTCEVCSVEFSTAHSTKVTCSLRCSASRRKSIDFFKNSVLCAGNCGALVLSGSKGKPVAGVSMCQPCRRVAECSEPDCVARGGLVKGLCHKHYAQARVERRFGNPECSDEWCSRGAVAHGLCDVHNVARRRREGYREPSRPDRPNCGSPRRRTDWFRAAYETIDRLEIFERDEWCCGICSDAVDPELAWPDPGSVVLDHIVPLARLRTPGHVRSNVQCAHNRCNTLKGNRLQEEIDMAALRRGVGV